MEEMHFPIQNQPEKEPVSLPTGKRELIFAACILLSSLFLINCAMFYGFHMGFAIAACLSVLFSSGYLISKGAKLSPYSITVLILSLVIAGSFARSDDAPVKFIMFCFLLVSVNLGLCLLAGKNRRNPAAAASLLDAGHTFFSLGFGRMPQAYRGIRNAFKRSGTVGQKSGAVILGLCIAVPILLIIVPLLMFADAAFEGLLDKLPDFDTGELIATVIFGVFFAFLFYTRGAALRHGAVTPAVQQKKKGLSPLTVNTVLVSVCIVYCVYLVSQLAYFSGGFSGILPEEYTMAEYARRGFFEMAWLCAINLCVMVGSLGLCVKEKAAPLSTRFLCLFIGIVTLFLVATASVKMMMYISSYGLTRLRVLTQVVMVFFAIVTVLVSVWLFVPKLPYMKAIVISAMLIGAAVSWTDVDSQVAKYNVDAYLSGKLDTVDVSHLSYLSYSAVPQLERLANEAQDPLVVEMAEDVLARKAEYFYAAEDFRQWNYAKDKAAEILLPLSPVAEDSQLH